MKLSIVTAGRGRHYGGNFAERATAAIMRNQAEVRARGIAIEYIFIEWNPPPGEDCLSYEFAKMGLKCWIVSPEIHRREVAPGMRDQLPFLLHRAKNVGIRRATGDWILVTNADDVFDDRAWDFIAAGNLNPEILYRAERCDVDWTLLLKASFDEMSKNIVHRHDVQGGHHFTMASGDFLLFARESAMGLDEAINDTVLHLDSRFCINWSAVRSNGFTHNQRVFQFIGTVFKADHALTGAHQMQQGEGEIARKGKTGWDSARRTCAGPAVYENPDNWGLIDEQEIQLCEGVRYVG